MIARSLSRVAAGIAPSLATLVLAELFLRGCPGALPIPVGTAIHSVYGTSPGDIYFLDPPTRARFMWPNYSVRAYWNGYVWQHRTDELGFRNPPGLRDRSLVWVGDSMIYGHGAEEPDTAADRLRREHGLGVYNAARQGDGLYQEYLVARLLLAELRPRTLVLTVFLNDFLDLETDRSAPEIAAPPELALDVSALAARLAHPEPVPGTSELHRVKLWRLLGAFRRLVRAWATAIATGRTAPTDSLHPIVDDAHWAPLARYYERVIADLAQHARESGAQLVVLDLDIGEQLVPGALPAQERIRTLLDAIGARESLRVLGTRDLFASCGECFLPHDGHFTREGHRRLAEFLAGALAPGR